MHEGIRAVLFDRDDTIAYTDAAVYRDAARWGNGRFGLDPRAVGEALRVLWNEQATAWWSLRTLDDEDAFWHAYGQELTRRLGIDGEHAAEWLAHFPYERYIKAVPGAREVLSALRGHGLRVGVLSNTLPSIERSLREVGLWDLVDVAISTCVLGVHKPEPQAFLLSAQMLDLDPGAILFIDDKQENVEAARGVGMRAELIDLAGKTAGALHRLDEVLALVGVPGTLVRVG